MLALHYLYHMLSTFRPLFSRHTPWVLVCVVIRVPPAAVCNV